MKQNRRGNIVNQLSTLKAVGVNKTRQSGVEKLKASVKSDRVESYLAEITAVYSEKIACDIRALITGQAVKSVPILTKGGLVDDEVYGELELPEIGDHVVIDFIGGRESLPIITGFVFPFLYDKFAGSQTPVNSGSKQFTQKLLEADLPKTYRKIFRSGTTIEVQEDGSYIIETPDGSYIHLNVTDSEIIIEDVVNSNKITFDSSGILIEDANGNDITMASGKVTINGNMEVAQ